MWEGQAKGFLFLFSFLFFLFLVSHTYRNDHWPSFQTLEAFYNALDAVKRNRSLLPGIRLGGIAMDSCDSEHYSLAQTMEMIQVRDPPHLNSHENATNSPAVSLSTGHRTTSLSLFSLIPPFLKQFSKEKESHKCERLQLAFSDFSKQSRFQEKEFRQIWLNLRICWCKFRQSLLGLDMETGYAK